MRNFLLAFLTITFTTGCSDINTVFAKPLKFIRLTTEPDLSQETAIRAFQYVGLHERTDRQELKAAMGIDPVRTEWCAAFVNVVLNESGIPGSESVSEYPLMARSFLKWGIEADEPKPGDVVVFPRGRNSWEGHVGFYLSTVEIDGVEYYNILGGNQSNSVNIGQYRADRALGIRRWGA